MIRCQACGTENPDTAAYCRQCARKLDVETQSAIVEQRAAHTATGVRWSAVILAAVIVLIIAILIALFATHVL
jgi:uncharacterized membrane protein YvbJ